MRTAFVLAATALVIACSGPSKSTTTTTTSSSAAVSGETPVPDQPAAPAAIALAIVFNGQEIWIGNEDHESEPETQYTGALKGLRAALAAEPPARALPAGSQAVVISYSAGAAIRAPLGPIEALTPDALGTQIDYRARIGLDLVQGVQLGLSELAKAAAPRKVLVVIGDGNDTNLDTARASLEALKQSTSVEIYALVYKSPLSADGEAIRALTPNVVVIGSTDGFRAALADLWRRVAGR